MDKDSLGEGFEDMANIVIRHCISFNFLEHSSEYILFVSLLDVFKPS